MRRSLVPQTAITSPCFQDLKHYRPADLFLFLARVFRRSYVHRELFPASHRELIPSINHNTAQYAATETLVAISKLDFNIHHVRDLCLQLMIIAGFGGLNHHGMRQS